MNDKVGEPEFFIYVKASFAAVDRGWRRCECWAHDKWEKYVLFHLPTWKSQHEASTYSQTLWRWNCKVRSQSVEAELVRIKVCIYLPTPDPTANPDSCREGFHGRGSFHLKNQRLNSTLPPPPKSQSSTFSRGRLTCSELINIHQCDRRRRRNTCEWNTYLQNHR